MADFCKKCWPEVWGEDSVGGLADFNDFKGICKPGEMFSDICEGCGPGHFDHEGARVRGITLEEPDGAQMAHDEMEEPGEKGE